MDEMSLRGLLRIRSKSARFPTATVPHEETLFVHRENRDMGNCQWFSQARRKGNMKQILEHEQPPEYQS